MGYVNKVFLMGNLTRDPELRYTPSGTPVCDFGMAINRNYTTSDGEQREEVCFVDVTFWRRRGEVINEYLGKGDSVFVEGRLELDQWETPEGRRSKLKVVGNNFEFVGGSSRGSGGAQNAPQNRGGAGGGSRNQNTTSQSPPQQSSPQSDTSPGGGSDASQEPQDAGYDVSDDEIPF